MNNNILLFKVSTLFLIGLLVIYQDEELEDVDDTPPTKKKKTSAAKVQTRVMLEIYSIFFVFFCSKYVRYYSSFSKTARCLKFGYDVSLPNPRWLDSSNPTVFSPDYHLLLCMQWVFLIVWFCLKNSIFHSTKNTI